jgi:uncharacterized protein (TIGR03000 family)
MLEQRFCWLRAGLLTLAGLLLASGVTWAHGGGGGHGGGGHGGGMHAGGFGHGYGGIGYGGIHHAGIGYYGRGTGLGAYGRGSFGIGSFYPYYGLGFGLGYGLGMTYGGYGLGYGLGYPYYGYGLSFGGGYPYYGSAYGYGGYPYYGSAYGYGSYPYYRGSYGYGSYYPNAYGGMSSYIPSTLQSYSNYYPSANQQKPRKDDMAHLLVIVPENAELWFNDTKAKQTGSQREFVSPKLTPGKRYSYEIKACWDDKGKMVEQIRKAHIQANSWQTIDFTKPEQSASDKKE